MFLGQREKCSCIQLAYKPRVATVQQGPDIWPSLRTTHAQPLSHLLLLHGIRAFLLYFCCMRKRVKAGERQREREGQTPSLSIHPLQRSSLTRTNSVKRALRGGPPQGAIRCASKQASKREGGREGKRESLTLTDAWDTRGWGG